MAVNIRYQNDVVFFSHAYSENPTLVRSTALANGWFAEEEIVLLDGLVSDENS